MLKEICISVIIQATTELFSVLKLSVKTTGLKHTAILQIWWYKVLVLLFSCCYPLEVIPTAAENSQKD